MGWLIALAVLVFIIYKINGFGKRRWKLTIAQATAAMQPNLIAATMSPLVKYVPYKRTEIFLRVMANYSVALAKGDLDTNTLQRDTRNVLCIIHGDEDLKRMLYDRYCETMEVLSDEDLLARSVSLEEFGKVLSEIRFR